MDIKRPSFVGRNKGSEQANQARAHGGEQLPPQEDEIVMAALDVEATIGDTYIIF